jgi:hypothetical protein
MSKQTIQSIYSRSEAMAEAAARWTAGNNAGDGYEIDESALEDAEQILTANDNMEVDVYLIDGEEVAVADCNGPWAVTI